MTSRLSSTPADRTAALAMSHQQHNRQRLLEVLRQSGGKATRTEPASLTGLSRATVSTAVDRPVADGPVREQPPKVGPDAARGRGRPAATLRLTAPSGW